MRPSGFFTLRTPLLPFDEILAFGADLEAPATIDDGALDGAVQRDRKVLRERLRSVVARPEVRDALFLGSPDLEAAIPVWEADPEGRRGAGIERALVRYVLRMAGRATPFGLFAGCSVGTIGDRTRLALQGRPTYRRHSRLDMEFLSAAALSVLDDGEVRSQLTYRPNSSLYRVQGQVRFVEARLGRRDGTGRSHHLVTVSETGPLADALARAVDGATPAEILDVLVARGIGREAADRYVRQLIESQVLVADHGPSVTGPEPLGPLAEALRGPPTGAVARVFEHVGRELAALDASGVGAPPERYRALARSLEVLAVTVELSRLFQVDMVKPASSTSLGASVVDELVRGVHLLHRLTRPRGDSLLDRFADDFQDRYDGREVPLVEALDSEVGVGFGPARLAAPLLDGLAFPPHPSTSVPWGKREAWLLGAVVDAAAGGVQEITLSQGDIDDLTEGEPAPLPDAFSVVARIAAASTEALDRGRFRVSLGGAWGPSGAGLLGRFCHADPTLAELVGRHLRAEEALDPDAVYAEIVHLPQGRTGNILLRPILRSHEIPYLGRSGAPRDRQIPVNDLLVSVRGGQILLRSARLDRRVVPRLTTAHDYSWRAVPVYRFLCALQSQGRAGGVSWSWGPLDGAPFLPRVSRGRLVLSPARWRIGVAELGRLRKTQGAEQFRTVRRWRDEHSVPRFCTLADGDNTLPIDFHNVLSVEAFVHLVSRRTEAVIEELFPGPGELCASGPEGRFVHEVVVPFVRTLPHSGPSRPKPSRTAPVRRAAAVRTFPPGSEWLYAKVYAAPSLGDDVLRALHPVVVNALDVRGAQRWFFIRHADPHPHLRLRIQGAPDVLSRDVLPDLEDAVGPLLADGRVWRFELGTYEREVERYGGPEAMLLCEAVFHGDSEAVAKIVLRLSRGDQGGDERWRLTLRGMHLLLVDLGFDLDARLGILRRVRAGFATEHRVDGRLESQLGQRFRQERADLERLLVPTGDGDSPLAPGLALLRERSAKLAPVFAALQGANEAGRLCVPLEDVATSLLHMHASRLLRSSHRAQELVLYDFLLRLYQSQVARGPRG